MVLETSEVFHKHDIIILLSFDNCSACNDLRVSQGLILSLLAACWFKKNVTGTNTGFNLRICKQNKTFDD